MHEAAVTATCVPVQIDRDRWCAGLFVVAPPEAACVRTGPDGARRLPGGPFAVQFEADLHEHEHGTVFELDVDIRTPGQSLSASLLFLTGHASGHFQTLELLMAEPELSLFIGDEYCRLLWQQRVPLPATHRAGLRALLDEAVRRDAVIRMTGRYEPDEAFADAHRRRRDTAS